MNPRNWAIVDARFLLIAAGLTVGTVSLLLLLLLPLPPGRGLFGFLRDVGYNLGPTGVFGGFGSAAAAAAGWNGGRNDPTGGRGPGQHPNWYLMPGRRLTGGDDGFVWYPSTADGVQYENPAGVKAGAMIWFSKWLQETAAYIAGEASGTTKASSSSKA